MKKEKAERIIRIYNWARLIIIILFLAFVFIGVANAQTVEERVTKLEQLIQQQSEKNKYKPEIHGVLRGKYEYQTEPSTSRFEIRNARLSASGKLPMRSEYKLEVDFCDETKIKMKDAWVRILPWSTLRVSMGQQRMPFSIDAHRNPSARYFANRSFIAKQVGDMRDVGMQVGYDFLDKANRKVMSIDAGIFNGSNLDNQKTAWFHTPAYSARIQYFPTQHLAIIPSVQHQQIAERKASYTSLDMGSYYENKNWHIEAEYLHKFYEKSAFSECDAVDAMIIFNQQLKKEHSFIERISYLGRYDWMQDHSSGSLSFEQPGGRLMMTDAERHRMTLGLTFAVRNPYFPTDIRLNYEKYWYPHGGAHESEQDKLVAELMIKF